ncbi:MAG: gamma-glutamylcyclotransferase family protein [Bacillota bacterium]
MAAMVFVYGTLMHGRSNHHYLKKAKFLGQAVARGIALYAVTPFYPGAVVDPDKMVMGEVYEVDNPTMEKLDELEDNGTLYRRELLPVVLKNNGEVIKAWVYLWLQELPEGKKICFNDQPWKE